MTFIKKLMRYRNQLSMKLVTFLVVLMGCQQVFATKYASFQEFKAAHAEHASGKLEELKAAMAKDFDGLPNLVIPEFFKTQSFDEMKARMAKMPKIPLPDFAGRKATLKDLRSKLEEIRKTASAMDKPDMAFFEEMKQTLKESLDPKVVPLELPELSEPEQAALVEKKLATVDVEPNRFVEDFGDEVYSKHLEATRLQKSLLASTGQARSFMVDQVYDVFGPMTFDLARATREMMRKRNEVQDLIDWEESVGAAADCVALQKSNFASINYSYGREMNNCATYAYYPARRYINSIFYPYLRYTVDEVNSLHSVVMSLMNRANLARDQESLLQVLDGMNQSDQLRFDQFATEVLYWEGHAFADAHIQYLDHMRVCGQSLIDRYNGAANYIMYQLGICPIPTKNE